MLRVKKAKLNSILILVKADYVAYQEGWFSLEISITSIFGFLGSS